MNSAKNNFDLLRLLLASTVFVAHLQFLMGSITVEATQGGLSKIAVESFFIVSGFLVFMSFENSRSVAEFLKKRVRRIYPGYVAVVLLCAMLGSMISSLPLREYYNNEWMKYLISNLLFLNFLHPTLPGVFENNRLNFVNASLWTIKIEVAFYLMVPVVAALARKFGRLAIMIALYCLSFAYAYLCHQQAEKTGLYLYQELGRQLPAQIMFFMSGALLYYYFDTIKIYSHWLAAISAAYLVFFVGKAPSFLYAASLGIVVIYFAQCFRYLGNFGRYGDISYGVYIYHFPVVQTLIVAGVFAHNPLFGALIAVIAVFTMAFVSWHFVEKRFLFRTSHYFQAEKHSH